MFEKKTAIDRGSLGNNHWEPMAIYYNPLGILKTWLILNAYNKVGLLVDSLHASSTNRLGKGLSHLN